MAKKEMEDKVVDKPKKEKKINQWLDHVKKYRAEHPDKPYKECLQEAKKTYKKGGVISLTPEITPNPEPEPEPTPEPVKKMKKVKKVKKGGAVKPETEITPNPEPAPVKKMKKVKKVKKVNFEK
jgi:hypothetical protein